MKVGRVYSLRGSPHLGRAGDARQGLQAPAAFRRYEFALAFEIRDSYAMCDSMALLPYGQFKVNAPAADAPDVDLRVVFRIVVVVGLR